MHQVAAATDGTAAGQQLVDGIRSQHLQVEGLAGLDAPRGIDAAHRLELQLGAAVPAIGIGQLGHSASSARVAIDELPVRRILGMR